MTRAELEAFIDAGDLKACLSLLEGMPEAEREAWRRGGRAAQGDCQRSSPRALHVAKPE